MAGPVKIAILANGTQASSAFKKVSGDASSMGSKLAGVGKKAALALGAIGVGAAVATVKFTKDAAVLDTKMREVVTLFGETGKAADKSLGVIQKQVRGLSNEFGIAQETLTGGLYQAISAGVPKENALSFLKVASKASIGGVTDVETAVDGLTTTINAFGLEASDAAAVADSMFATVKGGKALDVATPMLTGNGWAKMGDLVVGDTVHSVDGGLTEITYVSPRHWRPTYEVKFADGASLVASDHHLWSVVKNQSRDRKSYVLTTAELAADLHWKRGDAKWAVPVASSIKRPDAILPLDPYVLGLWLGDGHTADGVITSADPECVAYVEAAGFPRTRSDGTPAITHGFKGLKVVLREVGVLGHKHVPEIYLHASDEQRLALLQGLMDSDGGIEPRGKAEFCSTTSQLAESVLFLLRSLGIKATSGEGRATLYGKDCGPKYRVYCWPTTSINPFRLSRKAERVTRDRLARPNNSIVSIDLVETVETVCIQVAHDSHLYLAGESLTVTHNTDFGALSSSLFNIAPAAAAAGVSFREVNAGIATLTAGGTPTSVAATQMRAALTGLQKPSEDLDAIFGKLGFKNAQLAVETKGLGFALDAVKKASKGNNGTLQTLLGSTEAVSAANVIAGTGAEKFAKEMDAQKKSAGAAAKAYDAVAAGSEQSLKKAQQNFRNIGLSIGQAFLPVLGDVSSAAAEAADSLSKRLTPAISDLSKAYDKGGIDGLVGEFERLTGTQGKLAPVLDQVTASAKSAFEIVGELAGAFLDASQALPPFVSPLRLLESSLSIVASALKAIPDPIKSFAVQAGIAALVMPRLSAGISAATVAVKSQIVSLQVLKLEMTDTAARAKLLGAGMARLRGYAGAAAGVGGLLALSASANQTNEGMGVLYKTLGGAALGFSVGGPWGAVAGGAAGAAAGLLGLKKEAGTLSANFKATQPSIADYAGTLDQVTGAATRATRAQVLLSLQNRGAVTDAQTLGISTRDLVDYSLGNERAIKRVNRVLTEQTSKNSALTQQMKTRTAEGQYQTKINADEVFAANNLSKALGQESQARRQKRNEIRRDIIATGDLGQVLKGLPRKVVTQVKADGAPQTVAEVKKLQRQFKLTPRQVKILVKGLNIRETEDGVKRLVDRLTGVKKTKADITPFSRQLAAQLGLTTKRVQGDVTGINRSLSQAGGPAARPPADYFPGQIRGIVSTARGVASSGGYSVGLALANGASAGINAAGAAIAANAAANVRRALAAMRAEASVASPSKKTRKIGEQMGDGLTVGLGRRRAKARKAGRNLVRATLAGVTKGSDGISSALGKLSALVEKMYAARIKTATKRLKSGALKGKALDAAIRRAEKRNKIAQKATLRGLKDEKKALLANGKAQDKNAAKLDKAKDKYKGLVQAAKQYAATIKDSVVSYGSVIGLGTLGDSTQITADRVVSQLRARVKAARDYARLVKGLRKDGLNKTTIQQLLDAGVEGGLATAQALATGGKSAIKDINKLTGQIARTGGALGKAMAKEFKQAGINAAAGLVKGLEKRRRELDRIADRMAARLASSVRKSLGGGGGKRPTPRSRPRLVAPSARQNAAPQLVSVRLTADQASAFARGKSVQLDLDVFHSNGGKPKVRVA